MDNLTAIEVSALNCLTDLLNGMTNAMINHPNAALLVDGTVLVALGFAVVAVVRVNVYLWKRSRVGYLLAGGLLAWINPRWPDWFGAVAFFAFAMFGIALMIFYAARALWFTWRESGRGAGAPRG